MTTLTFRPFRMLQDMRDCRDIAIRCWNHAEADTLLDQISEGFYIVAEIDGRVVGFTGARRSYLKRGFWEIPWIAIDPVHHGKRLGSQLLTHLLRELTNVRRASVIAAVTQRVPFFEAAGFKMREDYEDGWRLMTLQVGPVGI